MVRSEEAGAPPPPPPPHNNQQLFSDYYLDVTLPDREAWRALEAEAEPVRAALAALWEEKRDALAGANEAQVEKDWVRPVLEALGHAFDVQTPLKTPEGTKKPDYVLCADAAGVQAVRGRVLDDALLRRAGALAVADAKAWDLPLDVTPGRAKGAAAKGGSAGSVAGGDALDNRVPAYQIAFYVQHTGLEWGVLTNGRLWRLFHRDSAHKLTRFYEADLPALLDEAARGASAAPGRFLYFWAFFRRAAFDAASPVGLAALLRGSAEHARGVEDSLKAQVFGALRHLAQGFLDYAPNGLDASDPATRRAIYDNSLILLYRLLFALYAEARALLPVGEPLYRDRYSLLALKRQMARDVDARGEGGAALLAGTATEWPRLKELFRIIDRGSPPLKVTTYNGGLFDPERHPFLEKYTVGDARLQRAVDALARTPEPGSPGRRAFVDYRDLSERHLGTIYEGLLEYRLVALDAPEPGGFEVALENDKGERKATGSYYTPDYVVKYLVEKTVGPALAAAVAGKATGAEKVAAVLGVNVLDPAMGSGHFLVEATEYVARFLVDLGVSPGEDAAASEADIAYWKRRVVHSCIYGVDLNPLAVDLAKLSLWLSTLAADRPLSFLDHHLRPGNALVGARLSDLAAVRTPPKKKAPSRAAASAKAAEAAGQISMMADDAFRQSMSLAVGNMWAIEESHADTVADVKEQERLYEALRAEFTLRYSRLADLVTALRFGLKVNTAWWPTLADLASGTVLTAPRQLTALLEEADALARDPAHRFFHWELEFPEVFFDRQGRPLGDAAGFDAVIGNPPYVEQERLTRFKPFFGTAFADTYHGVADLYLYFFRQGLNLLQKGGRLGFISSGTFARANFAVPFRKALPSLAHLETIIDFGENQPFPGAEMVRPSIVVLKRAPQDGGFRSLFLSAKVPESLEEAVAVEGIDCDASALAQDEWTFQPAELTLLFEKIKAAGRPLSEVVNGRMYRGVLTGLNEAFLIDTATRNRLVESDRTCAPLIKPALRGEDLRPWYQEDEGRWLILVPNGWTAATFGVGLSEAEAFARLKAQHGPVADYLLPFQDAARKRWDKGAYWWELRPCDYYADFDKPKILWPDISKLPRFSYDASGQYINDKGSIVAVDDLALLAILQSRVAWFVLSQIAVPLRLRAGLWQYQLKTQFVSRIPIPDVPEGDREALATLAREITDLSRERYALHGRTRKRLRDDLGDGDAPPAKPLNQKLTAWWNLPGLPALRAEIGKLYKRDIPVKERDAWDDYLADRRAEHRRLTDAIIGREADLNARVYALFGLDEGEIARVEEVTKYPYGEV